MDQSKGNIQQSIDITPKKDEFIEKENHCPLCKTELKFQHETNFKTFKVEEKAQCPACGLKIKSRNFDLH